MPNITIEKTWQDGEILTEAMLDAIKDGIEEFLNVTKIDADNLQDGAITNAKIANNAVDSSKILDGAVTLAKIADAIITGAKLVANLVVTTSLKITSTGPTLTASGSDLNVDAKVKATQVVITGTGTTTLSNDAQNRLVSDGGAIYPSGTSNARLEAENSKTLGIRVGGSGDSGVYRRLVTCATSGGSLTEAQGYVICAGIVTASTGVAFRGAGYTVTRNGPGDYTITFAASLFSGIKGAFVMPQDTASTWTVTEIDESHFRTVNLTSADINFMFFAIGEK